MGPLASRMEVSCIELLRRETNTKGTEAKSRGHEDYVGTISFARESSKSWRGLRDLFIRLGALVFASPR